MPQDSPRQLRRLVDKKVGRVGVSWLRSGKMISTESRCCQAVITGAFSKEAAQDIGSTVPWEGLSGCKLT